MSSVSSVQTKPAVSQFLPLTVLRESPTNPRKYFDPKKLQELSQSVKEHGVIEPLVARGKLADIDYAKVANRAIDEAKRQTLAAKKTPKPPIAAKTARASRNATKRVTQRSK